MSQIAVALLLTLLWAPAGATSAPSPESVDRGRLSLAWDARESGFLEEALGYLQGIPPGSPVAADAVLLAAECFMDLGRYAEAADLLEGPAGRAVDDGGGLLADVYWAWAWEATGRQDYAGALGVLERGRRSLPEAGELSTLAEATRFRQALAGAVSSGGGDLPSGESVALRPSGVAPQGRGWIAVHPWTANAVWVPETTLEDWMPALAGRLDADGRALWVRIPAKALGRQVSAFAAREGLAAVQEGAEIWLSADDQGAAVSVEEWAYRAAAEGLGLAGAAASAVREVREALEDRGALFRWVEANRGELAVARGQGVLRLEHPRSGRIFDLYPEAWIEIFGAPSGEWAEFWADLKAELARPPRAYRCFCGREAFLREVLVPDPGRALALEKGPGCSTVVAALCPQHLQYVTAELARSWGAALPDLAARVRRDAVSHPWDLSFARGEAAGRRYLVLEGEGVSGLGRSPELLLGALERVEGVAARGRAVRVFAPTPSTLVVAEEGTTEAAAEAVEARVLLGQAPRRGAVERLHFRADLQLPARGRGAFQLSAAE